MSNDHLFAGLALLDQQDSEGSHVYVHGIIHGGAAHREGSIQVIMGRYLRMCRFCMHVTATPYVCTNALVPTLKYKHHKQAFYSQGTKQVGDVILSVDEEDVCGISHPAVRSRVIGNAGNFIQISSNFIRNFMH